MNAVEWAAIGTLGLGWMGWLAALSAARRTAKSIVALDRLPAPTRTAWPSVTVVMPACNEAANIGESLSSLLAQDYPRLDLVVINDRSTDETGAIIDRQAAQDARLKPVHLTELPEGWLGKVHALHRGTQKAKGEWLLFADADVQFTHDALRRTVDYAETQNLDCLTALPDVLPMGLLADATYAAAGVLLCAAGRLWQVRDPKSPTFAGMGAFILVRRRAFERSPGFEWLKLEVADDMGLGLLLKQHGGRCDVVNAVGLMRLQFYASFGDMAAKMQKNYFAIMARFSALRAMGLATFLVGSALFPLLALAATSSPVALGLASGGEVAILASSLTFALWARRPVLPTLLIQLGLIAIAYLMLRSTVLGVRMGGITWRGKLYPTQLLASAQRVRV